MNNNNLKCPHCQNKDRPDDWFGKLNIINQKRHIAKCSIKLKPIQSASPSLSQFFNLSSTSSPSLSLNMTPNKSLAASSTPNLSNSSLSPSLSLHVTPASSFSTPSLHLTPNSPISTSAPSLSVSFSNDTYNSSTMKEFNRPRKRLNMNMDEKCHGYTSHANIYENFPIQMLIELKMVILENGVFHHIHCHANNYALIECDSNVNNVCKELEFYQPLKVDIFI